jgi:putative transposase
MPGTPVWQPRFHDCIIRNVNEYLRICKYIENNPVNWITDKFRKQHTIKREGKIKK